MVGQKCCFMKVFFFVVEGWCCWFLWWLYQVEDFEQEGVFQCYVFQFLVVVVYVVVVGVEVGFEQQQVGVGFGCLQFCYLFGGFLVLYVVVVVVGDYQQVWVVLGFDVFVGCVGGDLCMYFGFLWVVLFIVFGDGQWQVWIEYVVQYVDERYFGDGCVEQLWVLVEYCVD